MPVASAGFRLSLPGSLSFISPRNGEAKGADVDLDPQLSIIVATRSRAALLEKMFRSLDVALAAAPVPVEVVVVDNGSTDQTPGVIERWVSSGAGRVPLREPQPGKARALNRAIQTARAAILAFTDDDVEVAPNWVREMVAFFAGHNEYAAAMGRVRIPLHVTDPAQRAQIAYFRTLPLFEGGDAVTDERHLYGCNMAVRRAVFDRLGLFNERLGPGASGLHEDGDLARRTLHAGMRIGYMPEVVVYHAVEPSRLTYDFFRALHVRDARSRYLMDDRPSRLASLARLGGAVGVFAWWTLAYNPARRMRARGRLISHTEMVRLCWKGQGPGTRDQGPGTRDQGPN